jgi:hypothetical protein
MGKSAHKIGAVAMLATVVVVAFAAGRLSTMSWPTCGDSLEHACGQYMKARAAFVQAEREFERQHSPYRYPVHAAVLLDFERPDRYLARVSTRERP